MKVETWLFGAGAFFFTPIAIVYGFITRWKEPLGVTALLLTGSLGLLIGLYFWVTSRRIDPRPEDNPLAEISDGAGDQGLFAPFSYWPLPLAFGSAIVFAGLAVGWWLFFIGAGISAVALVGWVFEFYRGEHAH
jgi:hypothetical protein